MNRVYVQARRNSGSALLLQLLEEKSMAKCDVCGNEYERSMEITVGGKTHVFDSFECAIHRLAPTCSHCGCKVIGHGVEVGTEIFCCAHCARQKGHSMMVDSA